uniref:Uncharacterized protein n=1 Tax=Trichuris muris TaxID=70415 RepID=A0A5S6QE50_TRIMR
MASPSEIRGRSSDNVRKSSEKGATNASAALEQLRQKTREALRLASGVEAKEDATIPLARFEEIEEIRGEGFAPKTFRSSRNQKKSKSDGSSQQSLSPRQEPVQQSASVVHTHTAGSNQQLQNELLDETKDAAMHLPDTLTKNNELRMARWKEIFLSQREKALAKPVNENGYDTKVSFLPSFFPNNAVHERN